MTIYATADSFRQAVEDRLKLLAGGDSRQIQRLRRRLTFERFLARLQEGIDSPWILKGGMAMEVRLGSRARITRDVDLGLVSTQLALANPSIDEVTETLRREARRDLHDRFVFEIARPSKLPIPGAEILRFVVQGKVALRRFENLSVDVAVGEKALAPPDILEGSDLLSFAEIPSVRLHVVSKAQHFAEKILAFTKKWQDRENTRSKDLVDMVLFLEIGLPPADELRAVIVQAFEKSRAGEPPKTLPKPPASWNQTYPEMAESVGLKEKTVADAFARVSAFWSEIFG